MHDTNPKLKVSIRQGSVAVLPHPVHHWFGVACGIAPQCHIIPHLGLHHRHTCLSLYLWFWSYDGRFNGIFNGLMKLSRIILGKLKTCFHLLLVFSLEKEKKPVFNYKLCVFLYCILSNKYILILIYFFYKPLAFLIAI